MLLFAGTTVGGRVQASADNRKVVARIQDREIVLGRDVSGFNAITNVNGFNTPITGNRNSYCKLIMDGITLDAKDLFFAAACRSFTITFYQEGRSYQGTAIAFASEPGLAEVYLDVMREVPR